MALHRSDSREQQEAEHLIRVGVEKHFGVDLEARTLILAGGARVQVDGAAYDRSLFVEIFAHQGPLKGGQKRKVSHDALKLITLGRDHPGVRLVIAFADEQAARYATQGTWVAEALAAWGVEVLVVDVDAAVRDGIRAAQVRQQMVNPAAAAPDDAELG